MALSVIFASYEVSPFYKRGGLGDVAGSLPQALQRIGVNIAVVMPYYSVIKRHFPQKEVASFRVVIGKDEEQVTIFQGVLPYSSVPIYFLANRKLISVINLKEKRIEEFAFFDLAIAGFLNWLENQGVFIPDIVHCNDWHTALIPLLLQKRMRSLLKTVLTIHNLGYQGKGSLRVLDQLGIDDKELSILARGSPVTELNALGEGILHANIITTVSPQYAQEISKTRKRNRIYRYFRLRERERGRLDNVAGIINGIDISIWNPEKDSVISHSYGADHIESGKGRNKEELVRDFKLEAGRPIFSFIGRIVGQKGIGVLLEALEEIIVQQANIIILGSGQKELKEKLAKIKAQFPHSVHLEFDYDEQLAHRIYAASDFLLIPSLYEPCGLVQMIGMQYGTIPIASRTGGLIDSIQEGRTGFLFQPGSSHDLIKTVKRALEVYKDKDAFQAMRKRCMQQDFSWEKSAKEYKKLYEQLISEET